MGQSKETLVAQLRDPSTKGRRGSIVWALREGGIDCRDILGDLVTCILEGSYEEVDHAHAILYEMGDVENAEVEYLRIHRAVIEGIKEDWREDAIAELLDWFD